MSAKPESIDCVVVGAGIVGLSIADELARGGASVVVVDRQAPGREASWAGAGMLPPGSIFTDNPAVEQLAQLSRPLHAVLSERIRDQVGVDDEHTQSGAIYLCEDDREAENLRGTFERWEAFDVPFERLSPADVVRLAPTLAPSLQERAARHGAFHLPGEAQVRNPRRLRGLVALCASQGVTMRLNDEVAHVSAADSGVQLQMLSGPPIAAGWVCFAAGAWSDVYLRMAGQRPRMKPIRGQAILLEDPSSKRRVTRTIHHGSYYVVPRRDGRMLVGSTMEDVGFDKSTTADACAGMLRFASDVGLGDLSLSRHWAGLRPGTDDELPLIGPAPGRERVCFATGHFRAGLQLAPATAVLVRELILGQPLSMDLTPFRLDR